MLTLNRLSFVLILAVTGCSSSESLQVQLNQFKDCSELAGYYKDALRIDQNFSSGRTQEMDARNASAGTAGRALEEGDQVKIAGNKLISAQYGKVQIVDVSNPAAMTLVQSLDYSQPLAISSSISENSDPMEVVVVGGKLYVVSSVYYSLNGGTEIAYRNLPQESVTIDIYDLNSPTIEKLRRLRIDGDFRQLRISQNQDRIYFITTKRAEFLSTSISAVEAESSVGKLNRGESTEAVACQCQDLYFVPAKASEGGLSIAHIHSLSTQDNSASLKQEFSIVGFQPVLRATNYGYLLSLGLSRRSEIELVVADSSFKMNALSGVEKSLIVLAKEGSDGLKPRAQGLVFGSVAEQFNMEVRDDIVQIFSTMRADSGDDLVRSAGASTSLSPTQQQTLLTTLRAEEGVLKQVHQIDQIGKDEVLFSTLFTDGKAYAVTSQAQIFWDPLFAIDLSNFLAPKLVGELEIDGFSRQLQETPSGSILAIGREAPNHIVGGIHVSLFGENATLIDRVIFGSNSTYSAAAGSGFWSIGDDGYKAYLYDSEAGLLFLPSSQNSWDFSGRAWAELDADNKVNVFEIQNDQILSRAPIATEHYVSRVLKAQNAYFFVNEGQVLARSLEDPSVGLGLLALP